MRRAEQTDTDLEELADGLREIAGRLGDDERAMGLVVAAAALQDYRATGDSGEALRGAAKSLGVLRVPEPEPEVTCIYRGPPEEGDGGA